MDVLQYFRLNEQPFRIGPDPRFLYLSDQVKEAIAKCEYMARERIGPIYIYGPIGAQTSPLNVRRIGGVTMAENNVSTGPLIARKPHRYQVDEGLDVRFPRHANSAHELQTLWRGLLQTADCR
jgi:type II secretory pathway predicted ATPase ExeA